MKGDLSWLYFSISILSLSHFLCHFFYILFLLWVVIEKGEEGDSSSG